MFLVGCFLAVHMGDVQTLQGRVLSPFYVFFFSSKNWASIGLPNRQPYDIADAAQEDIRQSDGVYTPPLVQPRPSRVWTLLRGVSLYSV